MEALALGLPVVATSVGGIPEVVTDRVHGLLVPPGRPDLLADAIGELVADPPRRAVMAAAASKRAEDFDAARATRRIEAIYRQVLAR
jgi:glycosyltransferase involved in cell wall biosynthesis